MQKEQPTKIDIVKIQMIRDGTLEYGKKAIKGPQDLAELGQKFIQNSDREVFLLVSLNTRNHINCIHVVSIGTVNTALVTPREVMKVAILSNAASIAFIHNHPSGDPDPSQDDIQITNRLVDCGKLFGIGLTDHVIISDDGKYESFLEKGLISKTLDSPLPQVREEDYSDFGRQYLQVIGYRKDQKEGGKIPKKPIRFKEFTELMKEMALQGIERPSEAEARKKEATDKIPDAPGDERHIDFVLEDLVKKIIRFRNERTEKDLIKLALWAYLLWLKLYPKQA
jgi:DNA repair protein RadC